VTSKEDPFKAAFGIDTEDDAHIIQILRDKLYSDKIRAVVREYVVNAADAHVEAGVSKPVHVVVPTEGDPMFRVRDYGPGLSPNDIKLVYTRYGKSTKRSDSTTTGELGLGCKSGFAYSDHFYVVSYQGLQKVRYKAYLDDDGVGAMVPLDTSVLKRSQAGIEIQIPVDRWDLNDFAHNIQEVCKWISPTPTTSTGMVIDPLPNFEKTRTGREYSFGRDMATFADERGELIALVGSISYLVPADKFTLPGFLNTAKGAMRLSSLVVKFDTGEIDVTPSREGLQYTKKTKTALRRAFGHALLDICKKTQSSVDTAPNRVQACVTLGNQLLQDSYFFQRLLGGGGGSRICYAGTPLSEILVSMRHVNSKLTGLHRAWALRFVNSGTGRVIRKEAVRTVPDAFPSYSSRSAEFWDVIRCDARSKWVLRAETYLRELEKRDPPVTVLYVLRPDLSEEDAFFLQAGLDKNSLGKTSDYEPQKKTKRTASSPHSGTTFTLLTDTLEQWLSAKSRHWLPTGNPQPDLLLGTGIYVELSCFFCVMKGKDRTVLRRPRDLSEYTNALKACGVDPLPVIYGFKSQAVKTLGPGWERLENVIGRAVKKALQNDSDLAVIAAKEAVSMRWNSGTRALAAEAGTLDPASPFRLLCEEVNSILATASTTSPSRDTLTRFSMVAHYMNTLAIPVTSPLIDMNKRVSDMHDRYPLLDELDIFIHYGRHQNVTALIEYIRLIDEANNLGDKDV
jgi:hypothetical protein